MNKIIVITALIFIGCKTKTRNHLYNIEELPGKIPNEFKNEIVPNGMIIHKGVFSPDFEEYYYTLSDEKFQNFDVFAIKFFNGKWSQPEEAFFNTEYNEHGMSFSPDGKKVYFSSTRPVTSNGISNTWHIWMSEKINGQWSEPVFIDIPNLRNKLVSHPTITSNGVLYFHSSNLDYSEMNIYRSKEYEGKFSNAVKFIPSNKLDNGACTPYVSPKEDYLIFARIGHQLDLMISFNDGRGNWSNPKELNKNINMKGQGNPYVTPDNRFLFFTVGEHSDNQWRIKWVNIESELKIKS
ncbi:hypothetical protein ACOSP6_04925 [Tenacibaculum sp. MEBiC06402]|uniref:hypothetical protein n=1 Tax=unclassified Tenacibaculum TaxID=2635139 RepID=UPI003B992C42